MYSDVSFASSVLCFVNFGVSSFDYCRVMESNAIRITHFINPHVFWYKPVSAYVHNLDERRFQLAVDEYCETNFRPSNGEREYDVLPGEMVAVLDFDRNKWCRCVVDGVLEEDNGQKRYILWAIDDGVPLQSSSRYVNPLPEKFLSEMTTKVKRGAVKNLLPSEYIYDSQMDKLVSNVTNHWDISASNMLQSVIENSATIYFRNITKHTVNNVAIDFGDLEIISRKDNKFYAAQMLRDVRKATEVEPRDFITRLSEIQTMNVNRSGTFRSSNRQSVTPPKSGYDLNDFSSVINENHTSIQKQLEINGVTEEDFDESASMVRPNHFKEDTRTHHIETIAENSNSEDDNYPLSQPQVRGGVNAAFEKQLWSQNLRAPNQKAYSKAEVTNNFTVPKRIASPEKMDVAVELESLHLNHHAKPTQTFASKLLRRKVRPAAKPVECTEQKPNVQEEQSRCEKLNIVPAGFSMGNVGFENGRVIAGDSSDSSERKSQYIQPSFKFRQLTNKNSPQDELYANSEGNNGKTEKIGDNDKVYITKTTSRFDKLIQDESW